MSNMCLVIFVFFFFFSSRRRHTRFDCDWSSDVCSSDLFSNLLVIDDGGAGEQVYRYNQGFWYGNPGVTMPRFEATDVYAYFQRSEEHTSELQSQSNLVCRLLLEKKKKKKNHVT